MENNGYFIKKLRLSKNLTQSQLAEGILSKNFLSRYERGESQVNDSKILSDYSILETTPQTH